MANKSLKVYFTLERDTKRFHVYMEVDKGGIEVLDENLNIGRLYLKKNTVLEESNYITVTIENTGE